MDDLVKRLRESRAVWDDARAVPTALEAKAADRIEALEAENARLRDAAKSVIDAWDWWRADEYDRCQSVPSDAIDDLRAALSRPSPGVKE